jgi:tetratricopeptide (TPR) repeat protein
MTPHGLIMKLNNTTMKTFPAEMVKKDWDYWNALEAKLIDQPDVAGSDTAIKAFSKCRCAIAGLYLKHGMPEQAIAAFQQALRLTPNAPEPNFRLANIYKDRGDYDKAGDIILKYMQHDIPIDQMVKPTQYLKELRHLRNTENKPPPSPATNRD